MGDAEDDDRRLREAFEAGLLAARLGYKAASAKAASAKRQPRRRKKTLLGWLRLNSGPLTLLMGLLASISTGAWTVYTYYRPAATPVVEPFDAPGRNKAKASPDWTPTPKDKPEKQERPGFKLLIDSMPQRNVPRPVQNVLFAASDLVQQGASPDEVSALTLKYLAAMKVGRKTDPSSYHLFWRNWNSAELVSHASASNVYPRSAPATLVVPPPDKDKA